MKLAAEEYYSGRDALSYGCPITIVCGERSIGKTYYYKRRAIKRFIERGTTTYYMRRYDEQIKTILRHRDKFFSDVQGEFPDYVFRLNSREMQLAKKPHDDKSKPEWQTFGHLIALSNYENEKSNQDADADTLIFEEFIKERKRVPYLENEVSALYNLWETLDRRENRIKIIMLGNAADLTNPYFLEWRIVIRPDMERFTRWHDNTVLLEYCRASEAFTERSKNSDIYRVTKGSAYDAYARQNQFLNLNDNFIGPKPSTARFTCGLEFQDSTLALWVDFKSGTYWCGSKIPKDGVTYALTRSDMRPNLVMLKRADPTIKLLGRMFRYGYMSFESVRVRETFISAFSQLGQL